MRIFGLLILVSPLLIAQPWVYNFGTATGIYNTDNSASTTFLPQPPSGGGEDRVRVSNGQGGSFNLENQIISFGSNSYLRIVASSGGSVTKFSIYDYSAATSFTLRFRIRFGDSNGSATGASSGTWYLFVGDGSIYSNDQSFISTQVFTGLQWTFGTSGNVTTKYRSGGSWISTGISGTPFTQGVTYIVDIYGNNSLSTLNYTYGTSQSIASNTFDLWVDGVLIGNDLSKSGLSNDVNIDSYMFYGVNSTSNVANVFLDDIVYTNTIAANPLPVELTSFSASVIDDGVLLNWRTETEVNNYGFEILRSAQNDNWQRIGFVEGHGNSNSPKEYSFIDNNVSSGKYLYRLKQIDNDGSFEYSKVIEIDLGLPLKYELSQNYPNPFNPSTTIKYELPEAAFVKLSVFNLLGEKVKVLVDEFQQQGVYSVNFDAEGLMSGIYFYRLNAGNYFSVKKMNLIK